LVDARVQLGRDGLGELDREAAGEHAKPAQHEPLPVVQQRVTPLERGPQRTMARRLVARRREQTEAIREAVAHPMHTQVTHAGGRKLDRKRQPVELAANLCDRGAVAGVEHESRVDRPCAGDEESDRTVALAEVTIVGGHGERVDREQVLDGRSQRVLARRQHLDPTGECAKRFDHARDARDHVLAVVEHQQHRSVGDRCCKTRTVMRSVERDVQRLGDCPRDLIRPIHGGEVDPPRAVRVVVGGRPGGLHRQARFPDAAGSHDGDAGAGL
jgi:hypothetical protein